MSAAHDGPSPAPWSATPTGARGDEAVSFEIHDANGLLIADVWPIDEEPDSYDEAEADAALIAAAPRLLDTLRKLDGWLANTGHDADHPWRVSIRAAIAKAGRS